MAWFLVPHLVITGSGNSKTSLDLMFLSKCQGSQKEALFFYFLFLFHFSFLPPSLPPTPPSSFLLPYFPFIHLFCQQIFVNGLFVQDTVLFTKEDTNTYKAMALNKEALGIVERTMWNVL